MLKIRFERRSLKICVICISLLVSHTASSALIDEFSFEAGGALYNINVDTEKYNNVVNSLRAGDFSTAMRQSRAHVDTSPDDPSAHLILAMSFVSLDRHTELNDHLTEVRTIKPGLEQWLRYQIAVYYTSVGRFHKALGYLHHIGDGPLSVQMQDLAARIHLNSGGIDEAEEHFQLLAQSDGQRAAANASLARIHLLKRDAQAAAASASAAIAAGDQTASTLILLGTSEILSGNLADAQQALSEALRIEPGNALALLNLAICHQALGEPDDAIAIYLELVGAAPQLHIGHIGLALLHLANGNTESAQASLATAQSLSSNDPLNELVSAAIAIANSDTLSAKQSFSNASSLFVDLSNPGFDITQQIAQTPVDDAVALATANLYYRQGYYQLVVDVETDAQSITPFLEITKARALSLDGDDETATEIYRTLQGDWPQLASPLLEMGDIFFRAEDIDQAVVFYEKAIAKFPENRDLQLRLGDLLNEAKLPEKAIGQYEAYLEEFPDAVNALNQLAATLMLVDSDYGRALSIAQKARDLSPNDPNVLDTLASVFTSSGNFEQAYSVFESVLDWDTVRNPGVFYRIGKICLELNKFDEAARAFEKALDAGFEFPERQNSVEELARLVK